MRLTQDEIRQLALATANSNGVATDFSFGGESVSLSLNAMNETLREEIAAMTVDQQSYEQNKYGLFAIISEVIDARLPRDLGRILDGFVETKQYGMSDVPELEIKRSIRQMRGRKFVTLGTPAGQYEVFKIAKPGRLPLAMTAATGAIAIPYEDFIVGRVDWNELLEIVEEGILDVIYAEVVKNFDKVKGQIPAANQGTSTKFNADILSTLIGITESYGSPSIICTARFARSITDGADWASEAEKVNRRKYGYMTDYKNAKILVLPQSYQDETNTVKVLKDEVAYIVPEGMEKIFHLALQGDTQMKEFDQQGDWSKELHMYKKFGVASVVNPGVTTYTISELATDTITE